MSVKVDGDRIVLRDNCGVEEAEALLQALAGRPDRIVVLDADKIHTALWQVLIALQPAIEGKPRDKFAELYVLALMRNANFPLAHS